MDIRSVQLDYRDKQTKTNVFLSYAHSDGTGLARRIVRTLEPYCNEVFWDWKLRAGDWKQQLAERIHICDFFLVIMSPAQAKSEVCQWELASAQERLQQDSSGTFGIVPVKQHTMHRDIVLEKFQYADFSESFEQGFGDLTQIMFGSRRFSWEHLASQPAQQLLGGVWSGHVPALIIFECCERLIHEKLWNILRPMLCETQPQLIIGNPRLPEGILEQIEGLIPQVATFLDGVNVHRLLKAKELLQAYLDCKAQVQSNDHKSAGLCARKLVLEVRGYLTLNAAARLNATEVAALNTHFVPDVAGIFREVIEVHARAMRLLS